MQQLTQSQIKRIGIIFVLAIIIISIPSIYSFINRQGKIKVTIDVIPVDSMIIVDGEKSSKTTYLNPGLHTFIATKDGFSNYKQTVIISDDNHQVALILEPESDEAKEWYRKNISDSELQKVRSSQIKATTNSAMEKNPILNILPKTDITGPFKIDYSFSDLDNYDAYITISYSTPDGRKKAFNWIRSNNIDPTTLDIRYKEGEFTNPLTGKDY